MSPAQAAAFESVSTLIDGEHPPEMRLRLIERCARETDWAERWSIYHLAGDALRSAEVAACHRPEFAARFHVRFAAEAVILAPKNPAATRRRAWLGGALAAAVAALAFVLVPLAQTAQPRPVLARAAPPAVAADSPAASAVSPDDPEPLLVAGGGWD